MNQEFETRCIHGDPDQALREETRAVYVGNEVDNCMELRYRRSC